MGSLGNYIHGAILQLIGIGIDCKIENIQKIDPSSIPLQKLGRKLKFYRRGLRIEDWLCARTYGPLRPIFFDFFVVFFVFFVVFLFFLTNFVFKKFNSSLNFDVGPTAAVRMDKV